MLLHELLGSGRANGTRGDILQASSELRPPRLSCRHSIYLPQLLLDSRDAVAVTLSSTLGRSFADLPFFTSRLRAVVQAACDATVLLDQYQREMLDGTRDDEILDATFHTLANVRVGIQHALLTLAPEKSAEGPVATFIQRTCCLALLIYSDIVLFVTPVQSGIRGRLATELLQCLTLATEKDYLSCNNFFAWAAMLGGIAASTSGSARYREAYIGLIKHYCGPFLGCRVHAIIERCTQFVWWSVVMDQPARAMLMAATKEVDE